MPARKMLIVTVLTFLAGCTSPSDPLGPMDDAPKTREHIESVDCVEQTGVFPQEAGRHSEQLPEGFELEPFDPAGEFASMVVIALQCDTEGQWSHETIVGLAVVPPAEFALADAAWHMMPLSLRSDNPLVVETWNSWGAGNIATDHSMTFDVSEVPAGRAGTARSEATGGNVLEMSVVATGTPATNPPGQGRAFIVQDRTVSGAFDVTWDDSLTIAPGTANLQGTPSPAAAVGIGVHIWGDWTNTMTFRPLDPL